MFYSLYIPEVCGGVWNSVHFSPKLPLLSSNGPIYTRRPYSNLASDEVPGSRLEWKPAFPAKGW